MKLQFRVGEFLYLHNAWVRSEPNKTFLVMGCNFLVQEFNARLFQANTSTSRGQ